ncbi:TetR/AcrR family transcriptional regulator C-terminal domain-containing protein [Nonomuraea sp. NPDC049758]|uniref:TetR/AcrR family transcriptional regulator C-terminal domain-containing protein n=1 Tax=Nonomuraea sp. NPDC049758 TaxID=3154360 RepID=UPI00343A02F6
MDEFWHGTGAILLTDSSKMLSTGGLSLMERLLRTLKDAGVPQPHRVTAADTILSHMAGFVLQAQSASEPPAVTPEQYADLRTRFPLTFVEAPGTARTRSSTEASTCSARPSQASSPKSTSRQRDQRRRDAKRPPSWHGKPASSRIRGAWRSVEKPQFVVWLTVLPAAREPRALVAAPPSHAVPVAGVVALSGGGIVPIEVPVSHGGGRHGRRGGQDGGGGKGQGHARDSGSALPRDHNILRSSTETIFVWSGRHVVGARRTDPCSRPQKG